MARASQGKLAINNALPGMTAQISDPLRWYVSMESRYAREYARFGAYTLEGRSQAQSDIGSRLARNGVMILEEAHSLAVVPRPASQNLMAIAVPGIAWPVVDVPGAIQLVDHPKQFAISTDEPRTTAMLLSDTIEALDGLEGLDSLDPDPFAAGAPAASDEMIRQLEGVAARLHR